MLTDYLAPVPDSIISKHKNSNGQLSEVILMHDEIVGIPDLTTIDIALVGVQEDRGSNQMHPSGSSPDLIREQLYRLYPGNWHKTIADLGNIYKGETVNDTYFALSEVITELVKNNVVVIILGGSQDLTYANYRAFDKLEQTVNLTTIDNKFDLGEQNDTLQSESFLSHIVLQQPYNLFNYSNLGYQTYFIHPEQLDLMDKMYFDANRLGVIRNDITEAEPVLRDTDIVSFDLSAIKSTHIDGVEFPSPNGFSSEEACALTRYAGISDKVSCIGFYNIFLKNDKAHQSSGLIAQMLWYFLEGVEHRKNDYPFSPKSDYLKFTVVMEHEDDIVFYKSPKSSRWWIEVPNLDPISKRHELIPCSLNDYEQARKGHIPNRWWKAIKKSI